MSEAFRQQAALDDLIDYFVFLAENGDTDMAERFLINAEAAFDGLARQPMIGSPMPLKHPDLVGMCKWRIKGFDNHLIFYMPAPSGGGVE
jgi:toxin ParE1/3/4